MQEEPSSILRLNAVKELTGLSRSSIYAFMDQGKFPQRINLGPRAVGWIKAEVLEWIANRVTASR